MDAVFLFSRILPVWVVALTCNDQNESIQPNICGNNIAYCSFKGLSTSTAIVGCLVLGRKCEVGLLELFLLKQPPAASEHVMLMKAARVNLTSNNYCVIILRFYH